MGSLRTVANHPRAFCQLNVLDVAVLTRNPDFVRHQNSSPLLLQDRPEDGQRGTYGSKVYFNDRKTCGCWAIPG